MVGELNIPVKLLLDLAFLVPVLVLFWKSSRHINRLEFRVEQLEKDLSESKLEIDAHVKEGVDVIARLTRIETRLDEMQSTMRLFLKANGHAV